MQPLTPGMLASVGEVEAGARRCCMHPVPANGREGSPTSLHLMDDGHPQRTLPTKRKTKNSPMIPLLAYLQCFVVWICRRVFGRCRKSVRGQHVLVTGGCSGIGIGLVKKFVDLGCAVTVWDLPPPETAQEILPAHVMYARVDVTDRETVYATARCMADVDILVLNAGIVAGKPLLESTDDMQEKVVQVNCISHFWMAKAFLPSMIRRKRGHIVHIASQAAAIGVNRMTDYCASKSGAFGFAESLRYELKAMGGAVKSTIVAPFYIKTGMFEGVRTRFAWLLPILDPAYVVDQIVLAVLTEKELLNLPLLANITPVLRLLPTPAFDFLADFLGINASMEHFVGRQKQQ